MRRTEELPDIQWGELWDEIEKSNPLLMDLHYHMRYLYYILVGKCASLGSKGVQKKAWIYISNTMTKTHILTNWNQVFELCCLIKCMTEINTSESIGLLVSLSQRAYWVDRIQIVDLNNGGKDSWFNDTPFPDEELIKVKDAAIGDFLHTAFDRLYYSNHPLAQEWRNKIQTSVSVNEDSLDPILSRSWKLYQIMMPEMEARGDLLNKGFLREWIPVFQY
jgi:hypothetical protein